MSVLVFGFGAAERGARPRSRANTGLAAGGRLSLPLPPPCTAPDCRAAPPRFRPPCSLINTSTPHLSACSASSARQRPRRATPCAAAGRPHLRPSPSPNNPRHGPPKKNKSACTTTPISPRGSVPWPPSFCQVFFQMKRPLYALRFIFLPHFSEPPDRAGPRRRRDRHPLTAPRGPVAHRPGRPIINEPFGSSSTSARPAAGPAHHDGVHVPRGGRSTATSTATSTAASTAATCTGRAAASVLGHRHHLHTDGTAPGRPATPRALWGARGPKRLKRGSATRARPRRTARGSVWRHRAPHEMLRKPSQRRDGHQAYRPPRLPRSQAGGGGTAG